MHSRDERLRVTRAFTAVNRLTLAALLLALLYLRQSFARLDAAVAATTPANALEPAGGRYGGQTTRLGLITLAISHGADHYGQLVVYLRMNGIVPPASR